MALAPYLVFITHFQPTHDGHGGNHRSLQIVADLESVAGRGNVVVISAASSAITRKVPGSYRLHRLMRRFRSRWRALSENPLRLMGRSTYSSTQYEKYRLEQRYAALIEERGDPSACVIEHPGLQACIRLSREREIPTVGCFQNLESLDGGSFEAADRWNLYARCVDFANEYRVLADLDERLFISKIEAGLVGGLGLPSLYYPYLPVGPIRSQMEVVRARRAGQGQQAGLCLMLGSAGHDSVRRSFEWVLRSVGAEGLPSGIKIVVAGERTETLSGGRSPCAAVELRGWVPAPQRDELLTQARVLLAPQWIGFGALTRLPEMALAGLPVLASRHASYALDPTPGLWVADQDWGAWCSALTKIALEDPELTPIDYDPWERRQPRTMAEVISRYWRRRRGVSIAAPPSS